MDFAEQAFQKLLAAKKQFGQYSYRDKGASEIMETEPLIRELRTMSVADAQAQLLKLQAMDDTYNLLSDLIMGLDDWEHFDELIDHEDLAGYY